MVSVMRIPSHPQKIAWVFCLLLSAQACAPDLGPLEKPDDALTKAASLGGGGNATYPEAHWWDHYGDSQLRSLIERGLKDSPTLAEATARLSKAVAVAQAAGAPLYPTISADATAAQTRQSYNNGVPPAFVPKGFNDTGRAALNFDYELDFFGKNSAQAKAALQEQDAARFEQAQSRIMVSTSIASSYANLAQYYAELNDAKRSADVRRQTASLFAKRQKEGLENESSVAEAEANYQVAMAEIAALQEQVDLTRNQLAALVGAPPQEALMITPPAPARLNTLPLPSHIPADLIAHRADIQSSLATLHATASRIKVARAGYYPNINLTGYIGHQSFGLGDFFKSGSMIGSFGPAIHLPIFSGGQIEGDYRAARADYDIALASYNASLVNALKEVADSMTSLHALQGRLKAAQAALDASEKSYAIVQNRYRGGLATYIEVLRAEDTLLANRRSMEDMRTRAFILDVALVKALGASFHVSPSGGTPVAAQS
jgi:NodT family efflux transporter outer membrane factor (OMF) lipoprotein